MDCTDAVSALPTSDRLPSPLRILLVEDSPTDVNLMRSILRSSSFQLTSVDRLSAARSVLQSTAFDVILLDLKLPDSHGTDTLDAVLEHAGHTAIVVLTGNDDEQAALDAVALGAQDYLIKGSVDAETTSVPSGTRSSADESRTSAAGPRNDSERFWKTARMELGSSTRRGMSNTPARPSRAFSAIPPTSSWASTSSR